MTGGSSRVSIPDSVRRTIQNIKEIAGGHSDEEIYAMLKECSMDPNEAAQKLLLQDPFHEVKRKGDRKKENREPADSRLRSVLQGRGGRGGRGAYSSRYVSHDAGVGSNVGVGKENGVTQGTDKSITSTSSPATHDTENKSANAVSVSVAGLANGSTMTEYLIFRQEGTSQKSDVSGNTSVEESSTTDINKMVTPPAGDVISIPASGHSTPNSEFLSSGTTSTSGVYASSSDTVLVTSCDAHIPRVIGAIGCEIGSEQTSGETNINGVASCDASSSELSSINGKNSSELGNSHEQGRTLSKFNGNDVNRISAQDVSSSSSTDSMGSRPSSNYSSRSQPLDGPQKAVGPTKEWKPKPTSVNSSQGSGVRGTSEAQPISAAAVARLLPSSSSTASEDTNLKLQKKLEDLQFSETHVIIPNHLQVPESQLTGLSFGSFEADFGLSMGFANVPDSDRSLARLSESAKEVEENVDKPSTIIHSVPATREADYLDHLQPPEQFAENILSKEPQISSNIPTAPENNQPKREATLDQEGPQYSVVCTAPTYLNLGPVPPVLGSHFATLEGAEPQSREASCIPGFVVQHHFDPSASYYPQIYQPVADVNGCLSKFLPPGAASQFNGNTAVLPQTGQSQQQSGNSSVLSLAGPTPLVTQAAGVIPSSLAVNQQPIPCFGQSAGVHLSHCPPNYISYSQYFSPFHVPPPTLHHLLSNTAFPQQLPTGSIYPHPAATTPANPVKYSLSQYEPPTNNNPSHTGMPAGFGTYSPSPASYSPAPAATSGYLTGNEDGVTPYKENNAYINCQQSEGPTVWVPVPGRDVSSLQAGSFHNLLPQGQHVAFTPTQAGHGSNGIYHPNQTVAAGSVHPLLQQLQARAGAAESVGPPAGAYQQPQHAAINWVNNY